MKIGPQLRRPPLGGRARSRTPIADGGAGQAAARRPADGTDKDAVALTERADRARLAAGRRLAGPASATSSRATSSSSRSPDGPRTTCSPASTSCGGATSRRPTRPASRSAVGDADDLPAFHALYVDHGQARRLHPARADVLPADVEGHATPRTRTGSGSTSPTSTASCSRRPRLAVRVGRARLVLLRRLSRPPARASARSNAVQWRMIATPATAGATVYDLRGITDTLDPDDHLFGLIQFKLGTGGEAVEYVGEWDFPLSPLLYKAFTALPARGGDPMTFTLYVDAERAGARTPARLRRGRRPASSRRQGQRLRLRDRAARGRGDRAPRPPRPSRSGTRDEVARAREAYAGDVLVLTPWDHRIDPLPEADDPTIRTVSLRRGADRPATAPAAAPASSSSSMTSMHRLGVPHDRLLEVAPLLDGLPVEGFALHLPLAEPELGALAETEALVARWCGRSGCPATALGLATCPTPSWPAFAAEHPASRCGPGSGRRSGSVGATPARDGHRARRPRRCKRGDRYGYRQRRTPRGHRLLVVVRRYLARRRARGTAGRDRGRSGSGQGRRHGRPRGARHVRCRRSTSAASSAGSPSRRTCRSRCLLVRETTSPVAIGDELDCEVRFTTTTFDRVVVRRRSSARR